MKKGKTQSAANMPSKDEYKNLPSNLVGSFIPLPPSGTALSDEQLKAIFGGDLRVLQDMARLAYQSKDVEAK
jgi:hypothetical protein